MTDKIIDLCTHLDADGINYITDEPLSRHSSFRIGGPARLFVKPSSRDELVGTIAHCKAHCVKNIVVGNGSNILFADEGFDGVVISTVAIRNVSVSGRRVDADCGLSCAKLSDLANEKSLSGLEFLYGIPGSVGGAVFMNAGAYGGQMSDCLRAVDAYDTERGEIVRLEADALELSYRHSLFMTRPELIVLSAELEFEAGDSEKIWALMSENMKKRRDKQPLELPSAGSVFKRHEGYFLGQVIEECGLKGFTIGGAQVSQKHAGFIVNIGGATAQDVLKLISHIQNTVREKYGFMPECEIRYIS